MSFVRDERVLCDIPWQQVKGCTTLKVQVSSALGCGMHEFAAEGFAYMSVMNSDKHLPFSYRYTYQY